MKNNTSSLTILLDFKKYRIRVHKQTLHFLDDPAFLQLLVNPELGYIAIRKGYEGGPLVHRINKYTNSSDKCLELYSRNLLQTLQKTYPSWQDNYCYGLYGEMMEDEKIIRFPMNQSILLTNNSKFVEGINE